MDVDEGHAAPTPGARGYVQAAGTTATDPAQHVLFTAQRQVDALAIRPVPAGAPAGHVAVLSSALEGNTWDGEVRIIDAAHPGCTYAEAAMPTGVTSGAWLPGGDVLAVGTDGGDVLFLHASRGPAVTAQIKQVQRLACHHEVVSAVVLLSPAGATHGAAPRVAAASWDGTVSVWDAAVPQAPVAVLSGHAAPVYAAAASPVSGSALLATGGRDCAVRLWEPVRQADAVTVIRTATPALSVAWLPSSDVMLAAGCEDGSVSVFDVRRLGQVATSAVPPTLVTVTQHTPLLELQPHTAPVYALAAQETAAGTLLVSGGDDAAIHVNHLASGSGGALGGPGTGVRLAAASSRLVVHKDYVRALLWADLGAGVGPQLLSGSWDKTVTLHTI
jgi:WD40 repeat protein